jgi:hypothetical protein
VKISSLLLSLAVLTTTFVPGVSAAQELTVRLGPESDAQLLKFNSEASITILAKLLRSSQHDMLKGGYFPLVGTRANYETIKILHAIESNTLSPEAYEKMREVGTEEHIILKLIFEDACWKPTKDALNALKGSHASYEALCNAIRQVADEQANSAKTTTAAKHYLEQLSIPCYCYLMNTASSAEQTNPVLNPTVPAQPHVAGVKSFFNNRWVKGGMYLLVGAAVVYGGCRWYKHANVRKFAQTTRLWA